MKPARLISAALACGLSIPALAAQPVSTEKDGCIYYFVDYYRNDGKLWGTMALPNGRPMRACPGDENWDQLSRQLDRERAEGAARQNLKF